MTKKLVITNRKGGSGKSSTSVNIAAELAARGQRVLLVDLDTQAHCAIGLGLPISRDAPTLHGFMEGKNSFAEAICQTSCKGLDLVPGNQLFDHGAGSYSETRLRDAISMPTITSSYDMVLFDTAPSLDALLINALCAADRVLVPFVPHFLGAEGVRQLSRVLFRVVSRGNNVNLSLLGFLPVMLDNRVGIHRETMRILKQQYGDDRMLPGVRHDIRVAEAFAAGQPLKSYAPRCRAAIDYSYVVDRINLLWS